MLKLGELYHLAIEAGIEADQRPREEIQRLLKIEQDKFEKLEGDEKERFDQERLSNPFADSRILHGDPELKVRSALVGIDIGPSEVLLADRLKSRGVAIDLIISHHPAGRALAALADVMSLQTDLWAQRGVPIGQAEGVFSSRIKDVAAAVSATNHNRAVDVARLLDIPMMCLHTPADNCVTRFLGFELERKRPYLLGDVIDLLLEVDEYRHYASEIAAPKILVGSRENRAGDVHVDMTGGTSGPKDMYEIISKATSISTIVVMHIPAEHKKEVEKHHLKCIVAPHMPSDTLGLNLILDACEAHGELSIIECSGFRRVNRNQREG